MQLNKIDSEFSKETQGFYKEIAELKDKIEKNKNEIAKIKDEIFLFKKEIKWTIRAVKSETKYESKIIKSNKNISIREKQKSINKIEVLQMQTLFYLKDKQTERFNILNDKISNFEFENENLKTKIISLKNELNESKAETKNIHLSRKLKEEYKNEISEIKMLNINFKKDKKSSLKNKNAEIKKLLEDFKKNNPEIKYPYMKLLKMMIFQIKPIKNPIDEKMYDLLLKYNEIKDKRISLVKEEKEKIKIEKHNINLKYGNFEFGKARNNITDILTFKAYKFTNSSFIIALRNGYFCLIPFILIGAFAIFVNNVLLNYDEGAILHLFNLSAHSKSIVDSLKIPGLILYRTTYGVLSILLCISVSLSLASFYKINKLMAACTSLSCFTVICPTFVSDIDMLGMKGLFVSTIVSMTSITLYNKFRYLTRLVSPRLIAINKNLTDSFEQILLMIFILLIYSLISWSIFLIGKQIGPVQFGNLQSITITSLFDIIQVIFEKIIWYLKNGFFGKLIILLLWQIIWFLGVRSSEIINPIISHQNSNIGSISAESIFNGSFLNHGVTDGIIALIVLILLFSKRQEWKIVSAIALIPSFFNINEPVLFGLPIILNPLFFASFMLAPISGAVIGFIAIHLHIISADSTSLLNANTPVIIGSIISTKSIFGVFVTAIIFIVQMGIYLPPILISNKNINKELLVRAQYKKDRLDKSNQNFNSYLKH